MTSADPLLLALLGVLMFGVNTVVWTVVGVVRGLLSLAPTATARGARHAGARQLHRPPGRADVAVLMAAHNEASVIEPSIRSAARLLPVDQIFVVSDGSTDETAEIARSVGASVLELDPNRGKAGALAAGVAHFRLGSRFAAVLLLDADTELDDDYFDTALPLLADPEVAVVAGRAATQWDPSILSVQGKAVVAHRERIYVIVQRLVKFGQAAAGVNAVAIAPGFASLYRSDVLDRVDMNPPGLVIEDFNMTFEIHRRRLGRIAFHPARAVARTQDPATVHDYRKQVRRWALGFWQTVRLHGLFHRGAFWPVLTGYCVELVVSSAVLLLTVSVLALQLCLLAVRAIGADVSLPAVVPAAQWLALVLFAPDLLLTCLVALGQRRMVMFLAAPAYPALRVVDALLCLSTLRASFSTTSTGRWTSPERRSAGGPAVAMSGGTS